MMSFIPQTYFKKNPNFKKEGKSTFHYYSFSLYTSISTLLGGYSNSQKEPQITCVIRKRNR